MEFLVSILGKRTGKFEIQVPYHVESSFADSCLHVKANFVVSTIFYLFLFHVHKTLFQNLKVKSKFKLESEITVVSEKKGRKAIHSFSFISITLIQAYSSSDFFKK